MDSSVFLHRFGAPPTARLDRRALLLGAGVTAAAMLLPDRVSAQQSTPAAADQAGHTGGGIPEVELIRTVDGIAFPTDIAAGLNRVTMINDAPGSFHAFVLRAPDDVTDDELAAVLASEEPPAWFFEALFAGNPDQAPSGAAVSAVVHYPPGRYVVVNVFEGTTASFTASGNAWTHPAPVADIETGLVDFGFLGLDAPLDAGPQIWRLTNHGTMWHDISLLSAPAGATMDDLIAAAEADPATFPPAGYAHAGGVGAMSPGVTVWLETDLPPGSHVGACFLPTDDGRVHADLGMIAMIETT